MSLGSVVMEHAPLTPLPGQAPTNVEATAEVAVYEDGHEWLAGELIWFVDRRVREVVAQVADAYGGLAKPYFTGPAGASSYPDAETNMLDPSGKWMGLPTGA